MKENVIYRSVQFTGLRPLMFDPMPLKLGLKLSPEEKFYFSEGTQTLVFPSLNILAHTWGTNDISAVRMFGPRKAYKDDAMILRGSLGIEPIMIPIRREGKTIDVTEGLSRGWIEQMTMSVRRKNGVEITTRPILHLPWTLDFVLTFVVTDRISEQMLVNLYEKGGASIGLGVFRGMFGKYAVTRWEKVKEAQIGDLVKKFSTPAAAAKHAA